MNCKNCYCRKTYNDHNEWKRSWPYSSLTALRLHHSWGFCKQRCRLLIGYHWTQPSVNAVSWKTNSFVLFYYSVAALFSTTNGTVDNLLPIYTAHAQCQCVQYGCFNARFISTICLVFSLPSLFCATVAFMSTRVGYCGIVPSLQVMLLWGHYFALYSLHFTVNMWCACADKITSDSLFSIHAKSTVIGKTDG